MPSRMIHWILAATLLGTPALAQQQAQPYAGFQTRPIKALSAGELSDMSAGRGMGLALAAELNGYPGPLHVLELADQLGLTGEQRAAVKQQFDRMREEAIPIGQSLITAAQRALFNGMILFEEPAHRVAQVVAGSIRYGVAAPS